MKSLPFLILLFALSLLSPPASLSAAPQQKETAPAELRQLIAQSLTAVNSHKPENLTDLTAGSPEKAFGWVREISTKQWKAGLIDLSTVRVDSVTPSGQKEYLAVFHAWHSCQSDNDHVHRVIQTESGWKLGEEIPETQTGGFRVRDHLLSVRIQPEQRRAILSDRTTLERLPEAGNGPCLLRLSSDYAVSRLDAVDDRGLHALPYQQVGGLIAVALPEGSKPVIEMEYAGVVSHKGSDYILRNEATLNSYWYPHIARLPAKATVRVTTPRGWTGLAQGELTSTEKGVEETTITTFRNEVPVSYFTVNLGRYAVTTRQSNGKTLSVYLMTPNTPHAKKALDRLERALAFYEKVFGPFPYTRYSVIESNGPFSGALEGYSFATFGPGQLLSTLAHELAHTWWGGLIPNTYTSSMWNEAFAEYSDGLFLRFEREQKVQDATMALQSQRLGLEAIRHGGERGKAFDAFPLSDSRDTSDDRQAAIGYDKGNLVMRALEEEVGQEVMLASMKRFLTDHVSGEAGSWREFEAAITKAAGEDYRWFFEQWVERAGLPRLAFSDITVRQEGTEFIVEGNVLQEGTPYRIHLPLRLEFAGTKNVQDTLLDIMGTSTHFLLHTARSPSLLVMDPLGAFPLASSAGKPGNTDSTVFEFPR